MPLTFTLTNHEEATLQQQVNGQGGLQSFFRELQDKYDLVGQTIELNDAEIGRIVRYITYGPGGFEGRLSEVFGRSLRNAITA